MAGEKVCWQACVPSQFVEGQNRNRQAGPGHVWRLSGQPITLWDDSRLLCLAGQDKNKLCNILNKNKLSLEEGGEEKRRRKARLLMHVSMKQNNMSRAPCCEKQKQWTWHYSVPKTLWVEYISWNNIGIASQAGQAFSHVFRHFKTSEPSKSTKTFHTSVKNFLTMWKKQQQIVQVYGIFSINGWAHGASWAYFLFSVVFNIFFLKVFSPFTYSKTSLVALVALTLHVLHFISSPPPFCMPWAFH